MILTVWLLFALLLLGLNNNVAPSKSLATISNGIHPIVIQFPAYKGNQVFRDVRHLVLKKFMILLFTRLTTLFFSSFSGSYDRAEYKACNG